MPLILGILNLLGMCTYPLRTNFFFILFCVLTVLLTAYSLKPSVGGALSTLMSMLETLGYYMPVLLTVVRLTGYAVCLYHIAGWFSHPSNARFLWGSFPLLMLILEVGIAALIVETQNLFYLVVKYLVGPVLEEYWWWYWRNSESSDLSHCFLVLSFYLVHVPW